MKKKMLAAVLSAAMVGSLALTGCGSSSDSGSASSASSAAEASSTAEASSEAASASSDSAAEASGDFAEYAIATNDFGAGEYSLDLNNWIIQYLIEEEIGGTVDITDNQFTVDKIITQLQSQLSTGPDGVLMIGIADSVYPAVMKNCDEAGVPYGLFATVPTDADIETLQSDELFAGYAGFDPTEEGSLMAEKALEAGCTKAVICAGAEGDYNHDHRVIGFTETFEAGGGEVLGVAHCTDPSEGVTKASDLVSANMDADCAYGCGAGYITAFESVASNLGLDYKIYGSDITTDIIGDIVDGKVEAITGGANTSAAIGTILLVNYLDGNPIKDEDGKAPIITDLKLFTVTADNAEDFAAYWPDNATKTLGLDDIKNCLYRYNPDVTLDDIIELCQNYPEIVYEKIAQ